MVSAERHMKAMDKVHSLVSVRERNQKEIAERLSRAGFTPEEVEDAVSTSVRVGLVSDERYARAFIRGKLHSGWGRRKIIMRLARDGVSEETIELCSDEFPSPEDDYERALRVLQRRGTASSNPYASYMRRLIGKGFSYDVATRAVRAHLHGE